jgi:hypothetical protein
MKNKLSQWNRQRKLWRVKSKFEAQIAASAASQDSVPIEEVRQFFESIRLVGTGHNLCRVGANEDGGYLLVDDFEGISACYSPGVSDGIEFDRDLARRGIAVHMADASVSCPDNMQSNMTFLQKFLGGQTEGDFISMEDWIAQTDSGDGDLLLEMDIEGAEYNVLETMSITTLKKFRQIVIEFHNFDEIFQRKKFNSIRALFVRLQKYFDIIHLHHNNSLPIINSPIGPLSIVFEATLIRRDSQIKASKLPQLPHDLDRPNVAKHPNEILPKFYSITK